MEGLGPVAAAAAAFVGTHFLLEHPLRKPIVDTVGRVPRHLLGCCGGDARMARASLCCGTCRYAIVAGRRRPMGGGGGRDAAGVDPADGLDRSQPGASQSRVANCGARRGTRRLRLDTIFADPNSDCHQPHDFALPLPMPLVKAERGRHRKRSVNHRVEPWPSSG